VTVRQTASSSRRFLVRRPCWHHSERSSCTRIRLRWVQRSCPGDCCSSIHRCHGPTL